MEDGKTVDLTPDVTFDPDHEWLITGAYTFTARMLDVSELHDDLVSVEFIDGVTFESAEVVRMDEGDDTTHLHRYDMLVEGRYPCQNSMMAALLVGGQVRDILESYEAVTVADGEATPSGQGERTLDKPMEINWGHKTVRENVSGGEPTGEHTIIHHDE